VAPGIRAQPAHARERAARLRTSQVSDGRRPIEIRHANG
jgi:hypothetical protein